MILEKAIQEIRDRVERDYGFAPAVGEPRQGYGDLAFPCFEHAAAHKASPAKAAEEVSRGLVGLKHFERAEAANGFVSLYFSPAFYAEALAEFKEGYAKSNAGKKRKLVIDYSSPNVGKPLHVGHIRSTILGDAFARLRTHSGWSVTRSNYLCEAGTQVAMLMVALEEFGIDKVKTERDLLDCYVRISKQFKENPALEEKARDALERMENGDETVWKALHKVREISLAPVRKNYELLGIEFDEEIFDSVLVPRSLEIVEEAKKKGIAFKDEHGETVVKLEDYKLPNFIVLRSNGTTLYSTRDLALADERFEKRAFDECVYVTASEQNTHFRQVFKTLELLGREYAPRLKHVGFGLISIPEGKLSTREGRVLLLEDFLKAAIETAKKEVRARQDYPDAEANKIAEQVAIGATKFAVLRVTPEKGIVFNPAEITRFEGHTGAFLQYSVVRCRGILEKAGRLPAFKAGGEFDEHEKRLCKRLAAFPRVVESASRQLQPHQLCDYLLALADDYSAFYANCPVLKAPEADKAKRLALVKATLGTLEEGLDLLGIQAPEKM